MIMCVLLCYPVSIRIYYQQGVLFLVFFGLILKNKMAATDVYSTLNKDFCWPPRAKGIIGRDLKLAGYVPHYKILTGNIVGIILKNKIAATGVSLSVMKSSYISLIIGPRGLGW